MKKEDIFGLKKYIPKFINVVFIITFILFASCTSNKVTVRNCSDSIPQPSAIEYSNYWSAVICASPEIAHKFDVPDEYHDFARGIEYIKLGNYTESGQIFDKLRVLSKNDTISSNAELILRELLPYQSLWLDYYNKFKGKNETEGTAKLRLLYPSFMDKPDETVSFTKNVDTVKINIKKGLIFVPVEINGNVHDFLFDTGAQLSAITDELADEYKVTLLQKHDSALIGSTGSTVNMETGYFNSFKIGNFKLENHPCFVVDKSTTRFKFLFFTFLSFDGIVGWNAIKNMDVEIDAKNEIMIIRKPVKKDNNDRNLFWLSHPIVKLRSLTGADINFLYDTGAQESSFTDLLIMKLKPEDIENDSKTRYGIGGKLSQDIRVIPNISFFDKENKITFIDMESGIDKNVFFSLDGRLGNDISKQAKFRIDALNGLFEITPNK